ncbi:MAG: hypothetical protein ACXACU_14130 [Candidatus Hodarchaeales archaeon]|jgi:hypothetical protein
MEQTKVIVKKDTNRRSLYKLGAIAAFLAAIIFRRNWSAEADILLPVDIPVTALEWFNLINENRLLGLVMLDFFDIVNNALVGFIFFTLYYALKDTNEIYMKLANIICFIGVAVHFASNQAFSMLTLSDHYFAASEAEKSVFLTAGEALLAINNPGIINQGSGIYVSMFLISFSGLLISLVMLQSNLFTRMTAYFGILANGLMLSYFITITLSPTMGWITIPLSAIPLLIWYILIGVKLYKLSKEL